MKIFLITFLALTITSCTTKEESIFPKVGTITSSIYASAIVQPDSAYTVYSNVSGIIEETKVQEGIAVTKDAPLFKITNVTSKSNAQNASLNLAISQERFSGSSSILNNLRENINTVKLIVKNDSVNNERQARLWAKNIGSKADYEGRQLKYLESKTRLKTLINEYKLKEIELQSQIKQAKNTYLAASSQNADFIIKSHMAGCVYDIYVNPGENVNPQKALATIGSAHTFIIEMLIDEVDIIDIVLEQEVIVTLEAYPNKIFIAHVSKIFPQKDSRNQTFKIEARFVTPPEKLYAGLSGEANIITSIKNNTLIIPSAYLVDHKHVKTRSGLIEVSLGLQSIDSIEITSGITATTPLLKPE